MISFTALYLGSVIWASLAVAGLINVIAYRLPKILFSEEESVETLSRPSACPICDHPIKWRHKLPIIGWLIAKGRCEGCKNPIPIRYPLVELAATVVPCVIALTFGFNAYALAMMALFWTVLTAALIDWDTGYLPDILTLPLMWAGILFALYFNGGLSISESIEGAVVGYLAPWSINIALRARYGCDTIAAGDFKLLAALGAWFGVIGLAPIVVIAVITQALTKSAHVAASSGEDYAEGVSPFGPGIVVGAMPLIFFSEHLMSGWGSLVSLFPLNNSI